MPALFHGRKGAIEELPFVLRQDRVDTGPDGRVPAADQLLWWRQWGWHLAGPGLLERKAVRPRGKGAELHHQVLERCSIDSHGRKDGRRERLALDCRVADAAAPVLRRLSRPVASCYWATPKGWERRML